MLVGRKNSESLSTHILGLAIGLEIWLNRFVLLVEMGQVRNQVLDDVGVWEWVNARFLGGIGRDTACDSLAMSQNLIIPL
jgi:hypothetical protein